MHAYIFLYYVIRVNNIHLAAAGACAQHNHAYVAIYAMYIYIYI